MKHLFKVLTLFSVVSVVLMVSGCPHKSEPEPTPSSTIVQGMVKLELKGKSFQMGADYTGADTDENPVHKVTFTRDIYMCDHEVTQAEWQAVMGSNPSYFQGEEANKKVADGEVQENRPVEQVSWYEAVAFCNELTKKENITARAVAPKEIDYVYFSDSAFTTPYTKDDASSEKLPYMKIEATGYRLPTEAEWEIAARGGIADTDKAVLAGTTTESELGDYAWCTSNSAKKTHEVKKKLPNGYGLYDMSGNVSEWCWDRYGSYENTDVTDPVGAASGPYRVFRGGSWTGNAYLLSCVLPRLQLAVAPPLQLGTPPCSLRTVGSTEAPGYFTEK